MKVEQIYKIVNQLGNEILGKPNFIGADGNVYTRLEDVPEGVSFTRTWELKEDLTNIVDIGKQLLNTDDNEKLFNALVNHIGRVVFVNREYQAVLPSVFKTEWEYGSIMEKIDDDMPDSVSNPKWYLESGTVYEQDRYTAPKGVRAKLFNKAVTFQIEMSYTTDQLKQSFSSATQLNAFMSMIQVKIKNKMTINYANLVRATINNFIAETVYHENADKLDLNTHKYNLKYNGATEQSRIAPMIKAINLVELWAEYQYSIGVQNIDFSTFDKVKSLLNNLEFIKFSAFILKRTANKMRDMSTLFNVGGKERFTPTDLLHMVIHSEFSDSADVYLQSDTFHDEFTALPKAEKINFWQGVGRNYDFESTSRVHTQSTLIRADQDATNNLETIVDGVIGVLFDNDALGILSEREQTTSHYNGNGDFFNFWYKSFARYFNDYDENFVVLFMSPVTVAS